MISSIRNVQVNHDQATKHAMKESLMEKGKETAIVMESIVDLQMPDSTMVVIVQIATNEPHGSSEGQTTISVKSHEDPAVEVDRIAFIFEDDRAIAGL